MNYKKLLDDIKHIHLQDSFVLEIEQSEDWINFTVEFVLLNSHEDFTQPLPGEMYCYRLGNLRFSDFTSAKWLRRSDARFIDAAGEEDLGNIDALDVSADKICIEGDWGRLEVVGGEVSINFS